jgi:hypothetical protein
MMVMRLAPGFRINSPHLKYPKTLTPLNPSINAQTGIVYLVPGRNDSKDVIFVYPRPWLNTQQFNSFRTPPQMMQISSVMMLPRVAKCLNPNFDQQPPSLS